MKFANQINSGKGSDGGSCKIDDSDKEESPTRGFSYCTHVFNGEEANDDVGESGSATHEGGGDAEHVDGI